MNDDIRKTQDSAALLMLRLGIAPQEVAEALSDVRKQSEQDAPSKDF